MLHGGEPGFVEQQCHANSSEASYIRAARCEVLVASKEDCPEPKVSVFDHHGEYIFFFLLAVIEFAITRWSVRANC